MVFKKTFDPPPVDRDEILRYAGCRDGDASVRELMELCLAESESKLTYKVCWMPLDLCVSGDRCDFGAFGVRSKDLARRLDGCRRAVVFAATVGVGIDRLIARYGAVSPAKALMFDAVGTERIEALCDAFCRELSKEPGVSARPRFSPGYGDLDLSFQNEIFSALDCRKHIGLTVTDSLLMSPAKSVTAVVGLCDAEDKKITRGCGLCGDTECPFRSEK